MSFSRISKPCLQGRRYLYSILSFVLCGLLNCHCSGKAARDMGMNVYGCVPIKSSFKRRLLACEPLLPLRQVWPSARTVEAARGEHCTRLSGKSSLQNLGFWGNIGILNSPTRPAALTLQIRPGCRPLGFRDLK